MRDLFFFAHLILGGAAVVLPIVLLASLRDKPSWLKPVSALNALASWAVLLPAGALYVNYYPATKTLIKAGSMPWAHSIIMETKEHWGLLLPVIATVAAWLVYREDEKESKKWLVLGLVLALLLGIMGRIVKIGAGA